MRVVIAEDAALFASGAHPAASRTAATRCCAAVADGEALLAAVAEHRPDVAVVDIRMPPDATPTRGCGPPSSSAAGIPGPACWCSPSTSRPGTRPGCWRATPPGVGYLLKDRVADVAEFADALARVAAGGTALDPEVVGQLLRRRPPRRRPGRRSPRASARCSP